MEIDMNKMDVEKSVIISIPDEPIQSIGTICLICGEFVPLDSPHDRGYKICDKCSTYDCNTSDFCFHTK